VCLPNLAAWGSKNKDILRFGNWEMGIVFRLGSKGISFDVPFEMDAPINTEPWDMKKHGR
jgi:hypothetical protein